ncbi:hypothetical protein PCL_09365 [Purpureocillium lilacinum]|uniref:Uncharacterized protein n=1 Tax=Purpureocillium lilacinum TaxID=33203 RepID=A0A2U3EHU6_PURLI|nr:hypothetical protein Purlil1_706 [Purpureocillium lilacinum]PWI74089.1 hypothetical protein PCL_09365 [Purpureocillium lilacinum]
MSDACVRARGERENTHTQTQTHTHAQRAASHSLAAAAAACAATDARVLRPFNDLQRALSSVRRTSGLAITAEHARREIDAPAQLQR